MKKKKRFNRKLKKRLRTLSISLNYYLGNFNNVIWITGDGRSGTTWVYDLINWNKKYREMFEPFHPGRVKAMEGFSLHQYIRSDDNDHQFIDKAEAVFTGRLQHQRIDRQNSRLLYKGLLIKDIFANLFIAWVQVHFPHVRKIFLIRHPFAVALSKLKLRRWNWMSDPKDFLKQKPLLEDYLAPFEGIIRSIGNNFFERQVLIWAIIHYVPFIQLKKDQVYILFYEDLYINPEQELPRLLQYVYSRKISSLNQKLLNLLNIPTRVSRNQSTIIKGKSPITAWQKELSASQIDKGLEILERFGLDNLYGTETTPNKDIAEKLIGSLKYK